ncbi:MAG: class I SAM-dependent methyltransferase [Oceanicoccus sp.]|uniref:class I SAM-dependent methyltransferase n=1 Tax=Oceanicoccus sp. TaxID=2691044 RepID=UPI002607CD6B|nr:class I SAM-dependent methyltransferase [Oceanicoccus sp.]MCP3907258.1 class I SAM-dependent methyltransferase [Oceanicoccus sp.]MDG1772875.1 class I SAM-dependent methyltransferase [Oceanicoccus sp.]
MPDTSTEVPSLQQHDEFTLDWGFHAMLLLMSEYNNQFNSVLEVGSGDGEHARFFRYFNKDVYSVDLHKDADYVGDFTTAEIDRQFDLVWCSHVIEHQRNVGLFLDKIYKCIKPGGLLAISAPIHPRERMISGHISSWTPFLLCYNLILAGFDCSKARFSNNYELGLIVKKEPASGSDIHSPAAFDLLKEIEHFFPLPIADGYVFKENFCNWAKNFTMPPLRPNHKVTIHSRALPNPVTLKAK